MSDQRSGAGATKLAPTDPRPGVLTDLVLIMRCIAFVTVDVVTRPLLRGDVRRPVARRLRLRLDRWSGELLARLEELRPELATRRRNEGGHGQG